MSRLEELLQKIRSGRKVFGLGLMSGTSADGLDLALVEFSSRTRPKLLTAKTHPFPDALRERILTLQKINRFLPKNLILFSQFLGEFWAGEIQKFLRASGRPRPDFVASHGQTVRHLPQFRTFGGRKLRGTLQLGEAEVIAKRLGIVTVSDFRTADVALGGSGAPLAPLAHRLLFSAPDRVRAVLNIGGIANLTFLGQKSFWATDTGPGNAWSDYLAQKFYGLPRDAGGKKAARGKLLLALFAALQRHAFFSRPFPKSTGKEEFSGARLEKILKHYRKRKAEDVMATVCALTAWGAAEALRRNAEEKLEELYLAGGGAKNLFFRKQLQNLLPEVSFATTERLGYPADFLEAACFAVLGWWCLKGEKIGCVSVTGAKRTGVLGKISQE